MASGCAKHRVDTFYFGDYSEAEKLYNKGKYEEAVKKYQAYIEANPDGNMAVIAQYYLAKSHAALGQTEQAKALYGKIAKEHADLPWAGFSEAQMKELEKTPAPAAAKT